MIQQMDLRVSRCECLNIYIAIIVQRIKQYNQQTVNHQNMIALKTISLNLKNTPNTTLPDSYCIISSQLNTHYCPTVPIVNNNYRWWLTRQTILIKQTKPIQLRIISYENCSTLFNFELHLFNKGSEENKSTRAIIYEFEVKDSSATLIIQYARELTLSSAYIQKQRVKRLGLARKITENVICGWARRYGSMLRRVSSANMIPTKERKESEFEDICSSVSVGQIDLKQYIEQPQIYLCTLVV